MLRNVLALLGFCAVAGAPLAAEGGAAAAGDQSTTGPQVTVTTAGSEFLPLFNGVNLAGWKVRSEHGRDWSAENGEMVLRENNRRRGGGARALVTAEMYGNFELSFEYNISEGGNSGVFFRMGDDTSDGLEVQILDDFAEKHADLRDYQYTGGFYGMVAPSERVGKPAGTWQQMTVKVVGQQLTVSVDGKQVIDTDMAQFIETSRGRREALQRDRGYIGFQNYGNAARFRNVMLRIPQ